MRRFACLTYHRIGDEGDQYTVSRIQFDAQLSFLRAEDYMVEGFQELQHRLWSKQELPARYAVLTLDDGHISAMLAADCIAKYGFKATFFVTRDRCVHKPSFMRGPDIR